LVLSACGGGGGEDSNTPTIDFTGTWAGHYDTMASDSSLEAYVSGTDIAVLSASSYLALTGTISPMYGNLYRTTFYTDGYVVDNGGFLADNAGNHAGFLMSNGDFGVLEKGGSTTATWSQSDSEGAWSGFSVSLDASGENITNYSTATITIDASGNFTATGPNGDFIGHLAIYDPSAGTYTGTWDLPNASGGPMGNLKVWISADKTFAASYACVGVLNPSAYALDSCTYYAWSKQ